MIHLFHVTTDPSYIFFHKLHVCNVSCHLTFLLCWLVTDPVNVSWHASFPLVRLQVWSAFISKFFFHLHFVEWMSHCMMAGFKYGPQQTVAAGYVWGNPDLSSGSQENQNRFFFFHIFTFWPDTGNEEVWKQIHSVNQAAYYCQCF